LVVIVRIVLYSNIYFVGLLFQEITVNNTKINSIFYGKTFGTRNIRMCKRQVSKRMYVLIQNKELL